MVRIKSFLRQYAEIDLWLLLLLGISSGVPFLLILSTLSYWLSELNFSASQVSFFTIVSFPYCLKPFVAPYLERYELAYISKFYKGKKSFAFLSQIFLILSIFSIGFISPLENKTYLIIVAVLIAFFAAVQDIVIDGLRIERFHGHSTGRAASFSSIGFHIGKLASGSGTLYLAEWYGWQTAYQIMILALLPGMIALYFFNQSKITQIKDQETAFSIKHVFKTLKMYENIQWMIAFIVLFKVCDAILQGTAATFLYQLGLSKIEFANFTKMYGTACILTGTILGGIAIDLFGLYATTIMAAMLQAIACLLFAIQAHIGYDFLVLSISIGIENFTSGFVVCVAISMLTHYVKAPYSMSHFTFFYTIGSFSRVIVSAFSGYLADTLGWVMLYCIIALFFIPIVFITARLQRFDKLHERKYP
ncbi:MAG: MFS transporter [Proteobacteria bacterium]|nr:MFS transporter [Pseudomonadota bacterium]